jgi:hypothetical protein
MSWQNTVQIHNYWQHPKSLTRSFSFTLQVYKLAEHHVTAKTRIGVWLNLTIRTPVGLPWPNYPINDRRLVFISCTLCSTWILRSWDHASFIYSSITNKLQRYIMVFITINVLRVLDSFSAHHQELKTVYTASGTCRAFSANYRYRSTHSR